MLAVHAHLPQSQRHAHILRGQAELARLEVAHLVQPLLGRAGQLEAAQPPGGRLWRGGLLLLRRMHAHLVHEAPGEQPCTGGLEKGGNEARGGAAGAASLLSFAALSLRAGAAVHSRWAAQRRTLKWMCDASRAPPW